MSIVTNPITDGRIAPPYEWRGGQRLSDEQYLANLKVRFWAKVDKTPGQGPRGECWIWTGAMARKSSKCPYNYPDYGHLGFRWPDGSLRPIGAHVCSFYLTHGYLPTKERQVCHTCDNPPCVRPDHLWEGTGRSNIRDAQRKGRFRIAAPKPETQPLYRAKLTKEQALVLSEARKQKGLTIFDVAENLGIDFTHYSRFEHCARGIGVEQIKCLLAWLSIPETDFDLLPNQIFRANKNARLSAEPKTQRRRGDKSWKRYASPCLNHHRADLIVTALRHKEKPIKQLRAEMGIDYYEFRAALLGHFAPIAVLARVAAYCGLPFSSVYETKTARAGD